VPASPHASTLGVVMHSPSEEQHPFAHDCREHSLTVVVGQPINTAAHTTANISFIVFTSFSSATPAGRVLLEGDDDKADVNEDGRYDRPRLSCPIALPSERVDTSSLAGLRTHRRVR
jgi:hypothetical protein